MRWQRLIADGSSFVIGPPLIAPSTPEAVSETIRPIWQVFSGAPHESVGGAVGFSVDVRDVASLLLYFVGHPKEVDGERYIAHSASGNVQALADALRKGFPDAQGRIVEGTKGQGYRADGRVDPETQVEVDSTKAAKLLEGGEWIKYEKSVVDTAKAFVGLL